VGYVIRLLVAGYRSNQETPGDKEQCGKNNNTIADNFHICHFT